MTHLLLAAVLLVTQQPMQRSTPATQREADTDRARQAVTDLGQRVATVRSSYELLRRDAYNSTDAVLLERARHMRNACTALAAGARETGSRICRSCFTAGPQAAFERYRGVLPSVRQVGERCAARMGQRLAAARPAEALRNDVLDFGATLARGFAPYEDAILRLRRALNIGATVAR